MTAQSSPRLIRRVPQDPLSARPHTHYVLTLCHPLKSPKPFVYGVQAMVEGNGKPKSEVEETESSSPEFVPTIELLRRDAAERGPWTDEDERCFQSMIKALDEADRGY